MAIFVNREEELRALQVTWRSGRAEFVVVWGRRRVGKTALLQEFCRRHCGRRAVYWTADLASEEQLREGLSRAIYGAIPAGQPVPEAPFRTWEAALRFVGQMAAKRKLCLVIDEFPYLRQAEASISSVLQRLWDLQLSRTQLKLILCGSHIGMMEREVLSGRAPLFGRRTMGLHLQPFNAPTLRLFFKSYGAAERVEIFSVFGGVPKYLQECDSQREPLDNALELLVHPTGAFYDEPIYLFREELTEPRNYLAIVRAIACGQTKHNEIVQATGLDRGLVSRCLDTLRRLEFVKRRVPVTESNPERTRKSIYAIADPVVRFWYCFVAPNRTRLEAGQVRSVASAIRRDFAHYVSPVFEALCRRYLAASIDDYPGLEGASVGAWWSPKGELDVVSLNPRTRAAVLGECKWSVRPAGEDVLAALAARVPLLGLGEKARHHLIIFSRSGFTPGLLKRTKNEEVRLVALKDMEKAGVI